MSVRGSTTLLLAGRLTWLTALAFVLLVVSYASPAVAGDCIVGSRLYDNVNPSSCCTEASCLRGGCMAHAAHGDCILHARMVAVQPTILGGLKKFSLRSVPSVLSALDPTLIHRAQPPPRLAHPPSVTRYTDVHARTGRLLI